jgi:hypothetical protein
MKRLLLIPFVSVLLSLTGCESPPESVKVNGGAVHAHTFSFVTPRPHPSLGTDERAPVHRMIQNAITRNLASKGITKAAGGDLTVAYMVVIGNSASTEAISDYFGYSEETEKLHYKAHDAYTEGANRNYFEAGTLLIDVLDAKTHKLLKRGFATRPRLKNLPDNERGARIQEVVDQILSDLRVAH